MNGWWLPAGFTATGVLFLTLALGRTVQTVAAARARRRRWAQASTTSTSAVTVTERYGIPPLAPWVLGTTLVGGLVAHTLFTGPARYLGLLAGLTPLLWRQGRIRAGQRQVQEEVTDLVETLRLYLAVAPTPGAALTLALGEARPGILWARLQAHRDLLTLAGPATLLRTVAAEVDSGALRRLVSRLQAAQAGNTPLSAALRAAADELLAELHRELAELVEAAPTRLLLPSLVLLLPPALVVALAPPVQALLDTLAGAGPAPGL